MIAFSIIGFIGSELLALILMQINIEESFMISLYHWGSSLVTIMIAFPCFIGITRKMGMKKLQIKIEHKLSIRSHIVRLGLCLLPVLFMFGIIIVLDRIGMIDAESMVSWEQEDCVRILLLNCFLMPIVEEVMFRGILLQNLAPFGKIFAMIVSTVCFVLGHGNLVNMILAIVPGIMFANTVLKTKGLTYSMLYHMIVNVIGKIVLPLVVILVTCKL